MSLQLSSPAFDHGGPIPETYGYTETNRNPPLDIENVPPETESLALVVDDPDAIEPAGKIWNHWLVWNIDTQQGQIPAGWNPTNAIEGRNDFGETGYGGPNPPDREHTYRFRLFALDSVLDLPPEASKADLEAAIDGHVIDETTLEGTYAP